MSDRISYIREKIRSKKIQLQPGIITELKCGSGRLNGRKLVLVQNMYRGNRIAVGHRYVNNSNDEYEFNSITGTEATDAMLLIKNGIQIFSGKEKAFPCTQDIPLYAACKQATEVLVHEMA